MGSDIDDYGEGRGPSSTHESQSPFRSPTRERIVTESINANRNKHAKPQNRARWTKVKYNGYQHTFDSFDSLKPIRPSKVRKAAQDFQSSTFRLDSGSSRPRKRTASAEVPETKCATYLEKEQFTQFSETIPANPVYGEEPRTSNYRPASCHDEFEDYSQPLVPGAEVLLPDIDETDATGEDPLMAELDDILKSSRETTREPPNVASDHPRTYLPKYSPKVGREAKSNPIELRQLDPRYPDWLLQPDSRPISQEQLASEVKSIYAGLTIVETKCIHVDRAQAASASQPTDSKMSSDHWQALIALHRTLLHEHHDFFLASQHPSASPALKRLAQKYAMPARMWNRGIQGFLDVLRYSPSGTDSTRLEAASQFLQYAKSTVGSLRESLPSMEDDWTKILDALQEYEDLLHKQASALDCLNDLSRYDVEIAGLADGGVDDAVSSTFPDTETWLPQQVIDTMSGWLYYGQTISPNFNIFAKVSAVLVLAAHQCRYLCWKLW